MKRRKKRVFSATRRMSRRADRYRADLFRVFQTRATRSMAPSDTSKRLLILVSSPEFFQNTQSEGGAFEAYAAAEEEELDVGDVERDRFRYDHVPASMMLPKELMGDTPVEAVIEKPKRRTSARKKAGTKL